MDLLNPLIKLLPADYHWWLCNIIFVEALLCLFQTPVNCLFAKFYGLCPSSLQIVGAVVLPSIGAFYLKPFQGYTFLLFALGWFTGLLSTVKGSTQLRVNKWIGITATILLVVLRLLQGLALGGEVGGAVTYVAEHSPVEKRGLYTSSLQTTATLGLLSSLLVVYLLKTLLTEAQFREWGWRLPFLVSLHIRLVFLVCALRER